MFSDDYENISDNQLLIYPTTNSGYGATSGDMYCDELTPLNPISHYGILKKEAEDKKKANNQRSIIHGLMME